MSDLKLFEYQHKRVRSTSIDGQIWFVAKDVCDILEIVKVRDAVSRLSDEQKRGAGISDAIGRIQQSYLISESGVYKLAFRSNKPEAEKFTDWLANEVIPQIRKTGKYVPQRQGILPLAEHTKTDTQIEMSKAVNAHNFQIGGRTTTIEYNVDSCVAHTGKRPLEIKAEAKNNKQLKARDRQSAKQVIRLTQPEKASCMSLADNLVNEGHDPQRVFPVTVQAEAVFKGMIELGAMPDELKQLEDKNKDKEKSGD